MCGPTQDFSCTVAKDPEITESEKVKYASLRPKQLVEMRAKKAVAHLGVLGEDPLKYASAEYGEEILQKLLRVAKKEIDQL